MSSIAHIRMYPTNWRTGCMGLSLEQEGLYIRMCMFHAETGRRVPLDDGEAARALNANVNQYRKVLGQLLVKGKIKRHDNGYGNDRVEHERSEAEKAVDRKSAPTPEGVSDRQADQGQKREDRVPSIATPLATGVVTPPATPPVEAEKAQSFLRAKKELVASNYLSVVDEARAQTDYEKLADQLTAASAPAIGNPAAYPSLLNLSAPMMWLNQGADLELDILPTVAEVARKRAGKQKITSWEYFTSAVANAKAKRENGLPVVDVAALVTEGRRARSTIRADGKPTVFQLLQEMEAKAVQGASS